MASQRIPLVAGNWKMNFDHLDTISFSSSHAETSDIHFDYRHCEIALMPSFTSLRSVQVLVESRQFEDSLRRTGCFRNIVRRVYWRCCPI